MSNEDKHEDKTPNPPWLRNGNELALWPTKAGDRAALSGHVTLDGERIQVRAFINDTDKEGAKLDHPYLSLSRSTAGTGEDAKWKTFAYGNAMNKRSDGKPVYFDQVIFNVAGDSDKTFSAYVGRGCTDEFHQQLGFTSPQIERPAREAVEAPEVEEEASAPSP